MLVLTLALLTFIASQGLLVYGDNMVTCKGDLHRLACDSGLIEVQSSIYGRTDNSTCSADWSYSNEVNTSCFLGVSTIAERCNGLSVCELKTDSLDTPDPCPGTYKYYNTTYKCINGRVKVICARGYSTLDCGDTFVQIINANYGRSDSVTCANGLYDSLVQNTNCYSENTRPMLEKLCNGQRKCTVEASDTIFTDPCTGTAKYLTVSYTCSEMEKTITCEHNTAILNCGAKHIKIFTANYGRTDSTTCSAGRPPSQISNTNCYMPNTLKIVASRCEGKSSCEVPVANSVFSDPCYGTFKFLNVVYSCVEL